MVITPTHLNVHRGFSLIWDILFARDSRKIQLPVARPVIVIALKHSCVKTLPFINMLHRY